MKVLITMVVFLSLSFLNSSFVFASNEKQSKSIEQNLSKYIDNVSFRQQVLSQNIANINTPGYKAQEVPLPQNAKELKAMQNSKLSRRLKLTRTSSKHLYGKNRNAGNFKSEELKDPYETKPNGNTVSLTQQTAKLTENQLSYNTATKVLSSLYSLIPSVIGK
ncbi:MAG: flagellar basal body rod protein FlgB [Rickettsiaceae bacterium]